MPPLPPDGDASGPAEGGRPRRQYYVPAPSDLPPAPSPSQSPAPGPVPSGPAGPPGGGGRRSSAAPSPAPGRGRAPATAPAPTGRGRGPAAPAPTKRRRRRIPRPGRPKLLRWILLLPTLVVLVLVGFGAYGCSKFNGIERVELAAVLDAPSDAGTNYLIVGSDSREGTADEAEVSGERSDTILVMRVTGDGTTLMSIPRDLYVTIADTGEESRINAAYNGGPSRLVRTVQSELGLPVHHYLEVDFVSFAGLVDAVGGVTIEFEYPASDQQSGLSVPVAGPAELDGEQALAYVRSRQYTETIDGEQVTDPTADLGRVERQQEFLRAVMGEVSASRNPLELARMAGSVSGGLRVDDALSFLDAVSLARRLSGADPTSLTLPTEGFRTDGGAAVLRLVQPDAEAVLAQMGA